LNELWLLAAAFGDYCNFVVVLIVATAGMVIVDLCLMCVTSLF